MERDLTVFLLGFLACYPVTAVAHALAFRLERWQATKHPGRYPLSSDPRGRPSRLDGMNLHTECWRCGGRLTIEVNQLGETVAQCDACLDQIAGLQKALRTRSPQLCDWCRKEREEPRRPLCNACHREWRLKRQRECQLRLRRRRQRLPDVLTCCDCKQPLGRYRRKWCPGCAKREYQRIAHHKYLMRRDRTRRAMGPRFCQSCSAPIELPQRKWCVTCGAEANRKAMQRSK